MDGIQVVLYRVVIGVAVVITEGAVNMHTWLVVFMMLHALVVVTGSVDGNVSQIPGVNDVIVTFVQMIASCCDSDN